jgi:hypothetical protein
MIGRIAGQQARCGANRREKAMTGTPVQPDQNFSVAPHSLVFKAIALLAAGFVVAAWGFSADPGYIRLALGVVTALVVVAVLLSSVLAGIWRRDRRRGPQPATASSFRDWIRGHFRTSNGSVTAWVAAVEILLPIAAAVIGLAAFAIVRDIVAG